MSRMEIAFAAGLVVSLAVAANLSESHCAGSPPVAYRAGQGLQYEPVRPRIAEFPARSAREVLWLSDPTGPSPFGFVPTEWTVRPQLLPLTWDVQTVFAAEDARR
jgi:hypothetical protein